MRIVWRKPGTLRICPLLAGLGVLLFVSCARKSEPGSSGSGGPAELLERRYTYLIRGDEAFPTVTSGFRIKTMPLDDGVSQVELIPDERRPVDGGDSCRVFRITLKKDKDAEVMVLVADSIGSGMVAYEFGKLSPGRYTFGAGEFPPELTRWTKECKRLVVLIVVDKTVRHRARWAVTPHGRLTHQLNF